MENAMSQFAVTLIAVMFPGIISAIVADKITSHSKWDSFKFGLYSLVLGILAYALLQALSLVFDLFVDDGFSSRWNWLTIWDRAAKADAIVNPYEVGWAAVLAFPVAFAASFSVNYKVFNKIASFLKISKKFGDENLFSYFMNGDGIDWVYIRDRAADLTYEGQVMSFAENTTCHEVVLANVKVYNYTTSELCYEVPFIYLCKAFGEIVIESAISQQETRHD
jgi:hypothetical protein